MDVRQRLNVTDEQIEAFCHKWQIVRFELFGSVLRDDFSPESDVDALVTFAPEVRWTLFDLVHMEDELKQLTGRDVDLVERASLERSPNYIRRSNILRSVQPLYGAR